MKQSTAELLGKLFASLCVVAGAVALVLGFWWMVWLLKALVLGFWWMVWLLWCFVLPQVYPTGPEGLIRPSYWLFAGMWVLLGLVVGVIKRKV